MPGSARRGAVAVALILAVMSVLASCGDGGQKAAPDPTGPTGGTETPASLRPARITVLAASSLTEVFDRLARTFEAQHPGVNVTLSFAASSSLARQVVEGAPADVLATADHIAFNSVTAAGLVVRRQVFAVNRLAIAVAQGNPEGIRGLSDLARPGLVLVLCAVEVPCGRLSARVLRSAGVETRPASLEPDVKAVLSRVALGEADAGIVYATDLLEGSSVAGRVDEVVIPSEQNISSTYPAGVLRGSDPDRQAAAGAFVDLLTSADGRRILADHGFGVP